MCRIMRNKLQNFLEKNFLSQNFGTTHVEIKYIAREIVREDEMADGPVI